MHPRKTLSTLIKSLLPKAQRWTIYDHPAEVIKMPAVVIRPIEAVPETFERDAYPMEVDLIVARTNLATACDRLDSGTSAIRLGVMGTQFQWLNTGPYESTTYNDLDAVQQTMAITGRLVTQGAQT